MSAGVDAEARRNPLAHQLQHQPRAIVRPARLDGVEIGQRALVARQLRHLAVVDAVRIAHDLALRRLAEHLVEADHGQALRCDQIGQHLARPHRRQLVGIAHQQQTRLFRQRRQHRLHQRHVHHRHLVDHQQIAGQRPLRATAEAPAGLGLEQAVQGLGLAPGALAQAPRGAAGRCGERDVDVLADARQDRLDQGGLAGAGAAGDDQELADQGEAQRGLLARRPDAATARCSTSATLAIRIVDRP